MKEVTFKHDYETEKGLSIFTAGPIQGARDWQREFVEALKDVKGTIANPRTDGLTHEDYPEKILWETRWLNQSSIILVFIPPEMEHIEGRDYAQTTRFELAEWLAKSGTSYSNKTVIVCIDESFSGRSYIISRIKTNYPNTILCDTQDDCIEVIRKLNNTFLTKSREFFTSDTHFGAERTLELSRRPFSSVMEMDCIMIANWNNVVGPNDTVWHLGDFGEYNMIKYLNGNIRLIPGNYEEEDLRTGRITFDKLHELGFITEYNKVVYPYTTDDTNNYEKWVLTHKPSNCRANAFNLFGHIHGRQMIKPFGLDVGVDAHHYTPMSLDDVLFFKNAFEKGYYDNEVWMQKASDIHEM